MNNKRPRSENWLQDDKLLLQALVMENHEAIENKKTDTNSNARKVEVWTKLQNCFNTMCKGGRRTIPQLKSQWGTIKSFDKQEKKKKMQESMSTVSLETDNGPLNPLKQDPNDTNNAKEWHSQVVFEEIQSDSDTDQVQSIPQSPNIQLNKPKKPGTGKKGLISPGDLAVDMMQCDQRCRMELHASQMENEAIRKENLLIKQRLLRKKNNYYEQKIKIVNG